jgi:hypothetical protein
MAEITVNGETLVTWEGHTFVAPNGTPYLIARRDEGRFTVSRATHVGNTTVLTPVDEWWTLPDAVQGACADSVRD